MTGRIKNIIERVLVFVIGVPVTASLVIFFPQKNHLGLNLLVLCLNTLGALEFAAMLRKKNMRIYPAEAFVFGFLPLAAIILNVSFDISPYAAVAAAALCVSYCFITCAFSSGNALDNAASRLCAGIAALCYPGLFLGCLILMSRFAASTVLILTFLCAVMINDAAAWFFGMLFGKKNRGIVAASPNKSAAGFIAGYAAAIGVCVGASFLSPAAFTAARFPALLSGVILGLATGFAGTVGDLAESALKRSCGVKDSGALMPGRGGILDSIDSITFAAPVFYLLYNALFILS